MRDITKDLEERIKAAKVEGGELKGRIVALDTKIQMLNQMLETERALWPQQAALPSMVDSNGASRSPTTFSRFLQQALSDGGPRTLVELKRMALDRGIDFQGKAPGRVLHFALVGMRQSNRVERLPGDAWRIAEVEKGDG